ncbi:MAG: uridine kinase [Eubacteriales bacterium]|nr:uridine kinase [Eubacteriales bacterium]
MTSDPIRIASSGSAAFDAVSARVCALLRTRPRVILAIDGNCCAGKTTFAQLLGERLGADVFHMDDFFLQPERRTAERLGKPGGNVDAERFLDEVLAPISRGESVSYVRYDCKRDRLLAPVAIEPAPVCVVEGAYSLHPLLAPYYDIKVFCRIDPSLQIERIRRRNGEAQLSIFQSRWIPLENAYFDALKIKQSCDLIIDSVQQ